jgi:hypothetical protein
LRFYHTAGTFSVFRAEPPALEGHLDRLGHIHDNPFPAPQRHGKTDASGAAANVYKHILWLHVGGDEVQARIQASVGVIPEALGHFAIPASSRRFLPVETYALSVGSIDQCGVGFGGSHA